MQNNCKFEDINQKPMKKLITLFLVVFIAFHSNAQITVTSSNIAKVGDLVVTVYDSVYADLSGPSGGSQTWDLTSLNSKEKDTIAFISPAGRPGFSIFPTANLAVAEDSGTTFVLSDANEFTFLGSYGISGGMPDTTEFNWKWMEFPSNDGSNFSGALFLEENTIDLGTFGIGVDSVTLTISTEYASTIDGWGVVKTPAGNWDALRQKMDLNSKLSGVQYTGGVSSPLSAAVQALFQLDTGIISTSSMYRWWGSDANAKFFIASVDTGEIFGGNQYLDISPSGPPAGIYMTDEIPVEVTAYPNPVIQDLNIDLGTESGKAILRNILGQKTAEKVIYRGQNLMNLSNFDSGTYFLEIQNENGDVIETEKIQLVK